MDFVGSLRVWGGKTRVKGLGFPSVDSKSGVGNVFASAFSSGCDPYFFYFCNCKWILFLLRDRGNRFEARTHDAKSERIVRVVPECQGLDLFVAGQGIPVVSDVPGSSAEGSSICRNQVWSGECLCISVL